MADRLLRDVSLEGDERILVLCPTDRFFLEFLEEGDHSGPVLVVDFDASRLATIRADNSVLANVLFTFALARRTAGTQVTANCVAPGLVRTRIGSKHTTPFHAMLHAVTSMWGTTAATGAEGVVHLASAPALAGVNGEYFLRTRPARAAAHAYDEALAERLWRVSASLTGMPAE